MSFNKTGIDYCDYTFNLFTGGWGPGGTREKPNWCPYCYARKIADRFKKNYPYAFEPTIHLDRFEAEPPKKPSRIFVGSMGDMCGNWDWKTKGEPELIRSSMYIQQMLWWYIWRKGQQHQFILLTKNPTGLHPPVQSLPDFPGDNPDAVGTCYYQLPPNVVFGVSVEGEGPEQQARLDELHRLQSEGIAPRVVVSYEPALRPLPELWPVENDTGWLIIGAQTGPGAKEPDFGHIFYGMEEGHRKGWRVWVKDNVPPVPLGQVDEDLEQFAREGWPRERLSLPEVDRGTTRP